jgi:hypothetical protein
MRISYSDEEEFAGQFDLWQANCDRSIRGKSGQRELRALERALLAMPDKRLIHGELYDESGGVCAIGCYAKAKGLDISQIDPEDESDKVGIAAGMPPLVAWKVVEVNDVEIFRRATPEDRYAEMLAWVRSQLVPPAPRREPR